MNKTLSERLTAMLALSEQTEDGDRIPGNDPTAACVFVDMRPDAFRTLIEAAAREIDPTVEAWRPMDSAPRDGTMVRLLVEFTDHATEDFPGPAPTIGANNDDNVGPGEGAGWQFAGWCWTHDHFTEGKGTPVGWLPMLAAEAPPVGFHFVDVVGAGHEGYINLFWNGHILALVPPPEATKIRAVLSQQEAAPSDADTRARACGFDNLEDALAHLEAVTGKRAIPGTSGKLTLTAAEITDLAEFAGLSVTCPAEIEPDTEIDVYPCPADGVRNEGEPGDPGTVSYYRFVAVMTDYPEEGCVGLGSELDAPTTMPQSEEDIDNAAVDSFAVAMKEKLAGARAKGRGGWQDKDDCPQQRLSDMLRAHLEKGDPRDVANFCMFLHQRGESILQATDAHQWRGIFKLVEECGEVLQVLGKIGPFPSGDHPDGMGNLRDRITDELGDLAAAGIYFGDVNGLDADRALERRDIKVAKFREWGLTGLAPPQVDA